MTHVSPLVQRHRVTGFQEHDTASTVQVQTLSQEIRSTLEKPVVAAWNLAPHVLDQEMRLKTTMHKL
jgi:hypothetical protein